MHDANMRDLVLLEHSMIPHDSISVRGRLGILQDMCRAAPIADVEHLSAAVGSWYVGLCLTEEAGLGLREDCELIAHFREERAESLHVRCTKPAHWVVDFGSKDEDCNVLVGW